MADIKAKSTTRGRPAHQRNSVVDTLRHWIVGGDYAPNQRLPDRGELQVELGAASATIQAAIHRLCREGFLHAYRGRGTFVASHPPHLHRYAVVYSDHPGAKVPWSRMYVALASACREHERHSEDRFVHYHGVSHPSSHSEGYRSLLADIQTCRLAGIIFAGLTLDISRSVACLGNALPKVAVSLEAPVPGLPRVDLARSSWMREATQLAAAMGGRKVGLLAPVTAHVGLRGLNEFRGNFSDNIQRLGLETRDYWQLGCNLHTPFVYADWLQVLLRLPRVDQPDTVLIADDNLVECLTSAMTGRRAPRIVAHCNLPELPTPALPVHFVGFNLHCLLAECMSSLERQKAGLPIVDVTSIAATAQPTS